MKYMSRLLIFAVLGMVSTQTVAKSHTQAVRAYKTVARDQIWCIQIVDHKGKSISSSSFANHSAGVWVKNLTFKFSSTNPVNTIRVYKQNPCAGTPDIELTVNQSQITPKSQIHIESNSICIVENDFFEPSDEAALGAVRKTGTTTLVGAVKTDPSTYDQRWKVVTSSRNNPAKRKSVIDITKESRMNVNLAVYIKKPTWVFVYRDPASNDPVVTKLNPDTVARVLDSNEKGVLLINTDGKAKLVTRREFAVFITQIKRQQPPCTIHEK